MKATGYKSPRQYCNGIHCHHIHPHLHHIHMAILMNINQEIVSNYMLLAVSWCLKQAEVFGNCQPYFSCIYVYGLLNSVNCNRIANKIRIKVYCKTYVGKVLYMDQIFQYSPGQRSSNIVSNKGLSVNFYCTYIVLCCMPGHYPNSSQVAGAQFCVSLKVAIRRKLREGGVTEWLVV